MRQDIWFCIEHKVIGGSYTVTSVVAFVFFPQDFVERWPQDFAERRRGAAYDTLSFHEYRLSSGDTQM